MSQPLLISESFLPSEAAYSLYDLIINHRDETENSKKIAPAIIQKLLSHNLLKIGLPKNLGGWEDDPLETLKVYETLASAEASVAWVTWNNHLSCVIGRYLTEGCMKEIYYPYFNMVSNSTRPEGTAKRVTGGYLVSGHWSLVSGCELAKWFVLRCFVVSEKFPQSSNQENELKLLFIPKDKVNIINNWDVGGLNGTGSHDVVVKNVFVKQQYAISFDDPILIDNAYSRLPIGCINAAGCAAIALGILKGAIDELTHICLTQATSGKKPDLRDRLTLQATIAKSKTALSSKRFQLHRSVDVLWRESQKKNAFTDEQLADVWSASCEAAKDSRAIISEIYAVAGTISLYKKYKIERSHRDIHAVLQHGIVQPHWMNQAGMAYLKLKPTSPMFYT